MPELPEFLFVAPAETDISRLELEGLPGKPGEGVLLYSSIEDAEAGHTGSYIQCIVMVHAQRMRHDGMEFYELGADLWTTEAVPPKYIWISER